MSPYLLNQITVAGLYLVLAQSLAVAVRTGMISLMHASLFGAGAYAAALLTAAGNSSALSEFLVALVAGCALAGLLGLVAVRIDRDDVVLATLAGQGIFLAVASNWDSVTNGPRGISGIPSLRIPGVEISPESTAAFVAIILAFTSSAVLLCLQHSPRWRLLGAISEDEILVQSLGHNSRFVKWTAFVGSGGFAAVAGVVYAHFTTYVSPNSFGLNESIIALTVVIIGGVSSVTRQLLAVSTVVLIPEVLRFWGLPTGVAANVRDLLWGVALIVAVFWHVRSTARTSTSHPEGTSTNQQASMA